MSPYSHDVRVRLSTIVEEDKAPVPRCSDQDYHRLVELLLDASRPQTTVTPCILSDTGQRHKRGKEGEVPFAPDKSDSTTNPARLVIRVAHEDLFMVHTTHGSRFLVV